MNEKMKLVNKKTINYLHTCGGLPLTSLEFEVLALQGVFFWPLRLQPLKMDFSLAHLI